MVKYFAMAAVLVGSLAIADLAQARGRHGCASCGGGYVAVGGGCPGGMCAVTTAAPAKMAMTDNAPPSVVESPAPMPVAAATQPAPRYYASNTARRGLFGWRR